MHPLPGWYRLEPDRNRDRPIRINSLVRSGGVRQEFDAVSCTTNYSNKFLAYSLFFKVEQATTVENILEQNQTTEFTIFQTNKTKRNGRKTSEKKEENKTNQNKTKYKNIYIKKKNKSNRPKPNTKSQLNIHTRARARTHTRRHTRRHTHTHTHTHAHIVRFNVFQHLRDTWVETERNDDKIKLEKERNVWLVSWRFPSHFWTFGTPWGGNLLTGSIVPLNPASLGIESSSAFSEKKRGGGRKAFSINRSTQLIFREK